MPVFEAMENEQIIGRRERLPRAVGSSVDAEAYWNAAEKMLAVTLLRIKFITGRLIG